MSDCDAILHGREQEAPFFAKVDVVIVGSGSGGAVMARELARDGRSVLVIEEGGHYLPSEYGAMSPSNSIRRMAREAGLAVAVGRGDTPLISVLSGKCVGGSSVLTGGVCFRIPDDVLHEWSTDLGLTDLTPEKLAPYFEEVERTIHVETVPEEMRSRSSQLFVEGAAKMGIQMKSLRRNTQGCHGAARCNFGCPHGAKMSVDLSFLPDAYEHGARLLSDALVEKNRLLDEPGDGGARALPGRAHGRAEGPVRGPARRSWWWRAGRSTRRCSSAGAGWNSRDIGRHLTLHPGFRVSALFDEEVNGWDGSMQRSTPTTSAGRDHPGGRLQRREHPRRGVARGRRRLPRAWRRRCRAWRSSAGWCTTTEAGASTGGLARAARDLPDADRDRARMFRGHPRSWARWRSAQGPARCILPLFGAEPFKSVEELEFLTQRAPQARASSAWRFTRWGRRR